MKKKRTSEGKQKKMRLEDTDIADAERMEGT